MIAPHCGSRSRRGHHAERRRAATAVRVCRSKRKSSGRHSGASARHSSAACGRSPAAMRPGAARWPGPVVAAAVILDPDDVPRGLDNSKRLTPERREVLYARICARAQVAVAMAPPSRIDRDNILRASLWALARAVAALPVKPRLVFVDGRDRINAGCDCEAVIGGDGLVASIAAASIVAKVTRDRLMACLGAAHPGYGFERHMGYSVPEHFAALDRFGPTIHHRRSFSPVAIALAWWKATRTTRSPPYCLSSRAALYGTPVPPLASGGGDAVRAYGARCSTFPSTLKPSARARCWCSGWRRLRRRCCGSWCRCCSTQRRPAICRSSLPSATNFSSTATSVRRSPTGSPRSRFVLPACSAFMRCRRFA